MDYVYLQVFLHRDLGQYQEYSIISTVASPGLERGLQMLV